MEPIFEMQHEVLSPRRLADRWDCSPGWLANMRSAGTGPPWAKIGSKVLYRLSDIEAFELAHLVESDAA